MLHQAGELVVARDLAQQAASLAQDPGTRAAALDTLLGTLLALGDLPAAASTLDALRSASGDGLSSVPFHDAGALRRAGRFGEAAAAYRAVCETFSPWPAAAGAVAAARTSAAEAHLFDQQPSRARALYALAGQHWATARRRSGLYRCEAGQLRASLLAGEHPLPRALDDRIDFAASRQLVLLEAHVRIVRAGLRHHTHQPGADDDLRRAVEIAARAGARFLEGRARLGRRTLGRPTDEAHLLACLAGDAGWIAAAEGTLPPMW